MKTGRASAGKKYNPIEESIYRRASEMVVHARYQKPLDEFLRRALEGYGERIERIILFWSVAREMQGTARKNRCSQITVFTIANTPTYYRQRGEKG